MITRWIQTILVAMSLLLATDHLHGQASAPDTIVRIQVRGNAKVEPEAILTLIKTKAGDVLTRDKVRNDIETLFELGYFSDIRFMKQPVDGGIEVTIQVKEKPAIVSIAFEGLSEVKEEDIREKLQTKLFTILNEANIASDLSVIEKQYTEQGFYLAKATYKLEQRAENEAELTFIVTEGGKVTVAEVHILGNKYFSDADLIDKLISQPKTRSSAYSSVRSVFQDAAVQRDLEFISMYYRDWGFQKVKVARPIIEMDVDREHVRLTFQVEEGLQYNIESLDITGDLLYPKEELLELMALKPGELFRYSRFQKDVNMLIDKYGDLGFAFADINPKIRWDDDKRTAAINYEITKGDKVYFGNLTVEGNDKTRDNVIRREFTIADSELYSGTRLRETRSNVERLGFFEEVQVIKQRDDKDQSILHQTFKVKEKPTGQLQAALGFQPGQRTAENQWFGQGRYSEENQSGYGWKTSLQGRWNGGKNYELSTGITDPRVNDSEWSAGFSIFMKNNVRRVADDVDVQERRTGGSVTVGRKIYELIRASMTYNLSRIDQESETFLLERFREQGIGSSVVLSLRRNNTNNYLDPSEGSDVQLSQTFSGGSILRGDREYMESALTASYYFPIDFDESYRTYFKWHLSLSYIYPMSDQPVPFFERYRLGGPSDLRGYQYRELGPYFNIMQGPNGQITAFNKGGDKQFYAQWEYFFPLIPEAGIKGLLFTDVGAIYDDNQTIDFSNLKRDVGFGFRWITPIAPFRFEWAYPIENGKFGEQRFIFFLGY